MIIADATGFIVKCYDDPVYAASKTRSCIGFALSTESCGVVRTRNQVDGAASCQNDGEKKQLRNSQNLGYRKEERV